MKDKKAQTNELGMIIIIAVTLIVGVILFQAIAQQVGEATNTVAVANQSETLAANGASIYIEEYSALNSVVVYNATNSTGGTAGIPIIGSGNYTVTNNAINPTTNALSVQITTDDAEYASTAVQVSGTAEPLTYISNSGARSVASLIAIFFALSIAVVALSPTLRSGILEMMGK